MYIFYATHLNVLANTDMIYCFLKKLIRVWNNFVFCLSPSFNTKSCKKKKKEFIFKLTDIVLMDLLQQLGKTFPFCGNYWDEIA